MREIIATYAEYTSSVATVVLLCALTVHYAAEGSAIKSAIFSPFAVFALIVSAFKLAEYLGYIPK